MPCTTILVGRDASYDGSTIIARNEDCGNGEMNEKKFGVVLPEDQPRTYTSVGGHLTIELTDEPLRYTYTPDALKSLGVWGEAGINAANVAMTATETISSNERVLGADPLVCYTPAKGNPGDADYTPEVPGGIGEEDLVTLVLPYILTAKEGAERLGALLEKYGTYEMNGIAFSDVNDIWYLETIGGHHWIAKRVPDDAYVTLPNQFGIDSFDFEDAFGPQKDHMCSADLREFIADNHLDLTLEGHAFNPREAFGSHSDADHVYNTPRAWVMQRYLSPHAEEWDAPYGHFTPESDDLPWSRVPERKITIEDVKYVLGLHYQGTKYDPYGGQKEADIYRPIGINRNCEMSLLQIRPYAPESYRAIQWLSFSSNVYNCMVPLYTNIDSVPEYLGNTTERVTTDNMYWENRIIAALADPHFGLSIMDVEQYQQNMGAYGHQRVRETDAQLADVDEAKVSEALVEANQKTTDYIQKATDQLLRTVLFTAYNNMKNAYARNDAQ